MSRIRFVAAAALGALALLAASCTASTGNTSGATSKPAEGGDLVFDFAAAPLDLNPATTQDNDTSMQMMASWFDQLVQPNASGTGYVPMLASSWTVSPNQMVYTFQIRSGVRFSDGRPLTASDVVFSLKQSIAPSISLLNFLTGYVSSVTAPTPMSVQIQLKQPWPNLLADLASPNGAIYPAGIFTSSTSSTANAFFTQHPIGTGPFMLVSETPNTTYVVERNPYYWDTSARPHLDKITFQIVAQDTARATAVLGGQADIALSPPPNQVPSFEHNSSVRVSIVTSSIVEIICLNLAKYPMNNADVRQAVSLALNRQTIIKSGLYGYGVPATTYFVGPPSQTYQDTHLNLYPYDLTRARQLLKESGVKLPITIPFEVSTGTAQDAILTVAQADLARIGINLDPIRKDSASVDNSIIGEDYTAATTFWGDVGSDPTIQPLFADVPSYCCNAYFTGLKDQKLINLTDQAVTTTNRTQAQALYTEIQQRFASDMSVIPLYYPDLIHVMSANVTGFNVNPYGFYNWSEMGLSG